MSYIVGAFDNNISKFIAFTRVTLHCFYIRLVISDARFHGLK